MKSNHLIFIVISLLFCIAPKAQETVIHAGTLIDTVKGKSLNKVSIIVKDDKVVDIKAGFITGDNVIDLSDSTVMPGLMDMHTHIMSDPSPQSYTEQFFHEQSFYAIRATVNAKKTLAAGFTTIRDLGSDP
ncbi:MAG: amidohydrolase family protein, partial [Kangiellaceae bacterium]|nr:amidohydrolase family protein [Kangiellaceae bacterium]